MPIFFLAKSGFFLLMISFLSCNNNCAKEHTFSQLFIKSLKTIKENFEEPTSNVSELELRNSFFFLSKITGHPSSRIAGHFGVIYHKKEDYQNDVKTWEEWYDLNKNNYTIEDANKIFGQLPSNVKNGSRNWCDFFDQNK